MSLTLLTPYDVSYTMSIELSEFVLDKESGIISPRLSSVSKTGVIQLLSEVNFSFLQEHNTIIVKKTMVPERFMLQITQ